MRLPSFFLLLLGLSGLHVAAQNETWTIGEVSLQIEDFLQLIQNGSVSARGESAVRSLPAGCALAVRLSYIPRNSTIHTEYR